MGIVLVRNFVLHVVRLVDPWAFAEVGLDKARRVAVDEHKMLACGLLHKAQDLAVDTLELLVLDQAWVAVEDHKMLACGLLHAVDTLELLVLQKAWRLALDNDELLACGLLHAVDTLELLVLHKP